MVFGLFFQAEDGIRDRVRSRGLGDVYKRQSLGLGGDRSCVGHQRSGDCSGEDEVEWSPAEREPVSYTHLTLPTSDLV